MTNPDKVKIIIKLLQESNTLLIKSSKLQNEANIAVIDLMQEYDNSISKKIELITLSDNGTMLNVRELSLLIKVSEATIYNWINKNPEKEINYVIFDDDSDMLLWQRENFFWVDRYCGITSTILYKAKRFLLKIK